jgi:hypothetical protein
MPRGDAEMIEKVLRYDTWAIIGLRNNPDRAAYRVGAFLQAHGKKIIPINPRGEAVHGLPAYRSLAEVPVSIDVVDIFRRSSHAGQHVDEAIEHHAAAVWLQLGVIDDAAADRAAAAGLEVIMDRCPAIEWAAHGPQ